MRNKVPSKKREMGKEIKLSVLFFTKPKWPLNTLKVAQIHLKSRKCSKLKATVGFISQSKPDKNFRNLTMSKE